jgi:hypothetical protein
VVVEGRGEQPFAETGDKPTGGDLLVHLRTEPDHVKPSFSSFVVQIEHPFGEVQ